MQVPANPVDWIKQFQGLVSDTEKMIAITVFVSDSVELVLLTDINFLCCQVSLFVISHVRSWGPVGVRIWAVFALGIKLRQWSLI